VHNRYTPLNFGIRQQELHGALTQMTVIWVVSTMKI
jgi:hypothetical protein